MGSTDDDNGSKGSGRSLNVSIGGDAKGNAIVLGDDNVVTVTYREVVLPPPEQVDIMRELQALRDVLQRLPSEHRGRIDSRLDEAIDEVERDEPDKGDIGAALEGAINYAKRANEFSEVAEELIPRITRVCGWLGKYGTPLLGLMGLAV